VLEPQGVVVAASRIAEFFELVDRARQADTEANIVLRRREAISSTSL